MKVRGNSSRLRDSYLITASQIDSYAYFKRSLSDDGEVTIDDFIRDKGTGLSPSGLATVLLRSPYISHYQTIDGSVFANNLSISKKLSNETILPFIKDFNKEYESFDEKKLIELPDYDLWISTPKYYIHTYDAHFAFLRVMRKGKDYCPLEDTQHKTFSLITEPGTILQMNYIFYELKGNEIKKIEIEPCTGSYVSNAYDAELVEQYAKDIADLYIDAGLGNLIHANI